MLFIGALTSLRADGGSPQKATSGPTAVVCDRRGSRAGARPVSRCSRRLLNTARELCKDGARAAAAIRGRESPPFGRAAIAPPAPGGSEGAAGAAVARCRTELPGPAAARGDSRRGPPWRRRPAPSHCLRPPTASSPLQKLASSAHLPSAWGAVLRHASRSCPGYRLKHSHWAGWPWLIVVPR
jgi:hypothetical protein